MNKKWKDYKGGKVNYRKIDTFLSILDFTKNELTFYFIK